MVCGELVLEEAMDLPYDRLRNEWQCAVSVATSPNLAIYVFWDHDAVALGDEFPTFRRIVTTLFAEDLMDCLTLKMKKQGTFETSANVYNCTQHHNPEEMISQKRRCEKISRTLKNKHTICCFTEHSM
jgi:hypothetical protein